MGAPIEHVPWLDFPLLAWSSLRRYPLPHSHWVAAVDMPACCSSPSSVGSQVSPPSRSRANASASNRSNRPEQSLSSDFGQIRASLFERIMMSALVCGT